MSNWVTDDEIEDIIDEVSDMIGINLGSEHLTIGDIRCNFRTGPEEGRLIKVLESACDEARCCDIRTRRERRAHAEVTIARALDKNMERIKARLRRLMVGLHRQ
jgi:hypothetical protein